MSRNLLILVLLFVAVLSVGGCGNVSLSGDAMTAAENSVTNAYTASVKADLDPSTPDWAKVYLSENFKQWRFYVRSARKDLSWGPVLPSEKATTQPGTK